MAFKYGSNSSLTASDALVRGIGLFSLGLGLAEVFAPGKIAKAIGLEGKENLLRAYGAREIGAGIGTLSINPKPALWARFGGDFVDLATIAWGARRAEGEQKRNAMIAAGAVAGIAALDAFAAVMMGKRGGVRPEPADYSDRSGLPMGPTASRGYYRQKREKGPAVATHDMRADRVHSGGGQHQGGAGGSSGAGNPVQTETDAGQAPIGAGVAVS